MGPDTNSDLEPGAPPRVRHPQDNQLGRSADIDVDEPLFLYHGTTLHAANRIVDAGWQALDVHNLVDRIASEHGANGAEVREELIRRRRFLVEENRGQCASFAPKAMAAEHKWAQRAPEAEWETLWSIYRLRHLDPSVEYWNLEMAGHSWVWEQMRHEPLAVLEFKTCYSELKALRAFEGGFGRRKLGPLKRTMQWWNERPEVGFNLPFRPDPARLTVTPVPRHLTWEVYAHRLDLAPEEFQRRADRGDFGKPLSDGLTIRDQSIPRPWWDSATAPMVAESDSRQDSTPPM